MQEILLLHVTGEDRPGITAALAGVLAQHEIQILDMNQTVIHRTMLMGMLVRIPGRVESTNVLKDLLFTAHHLGLQLRMTPVEDGEYDAWVAREGKPRFILTLLARELGAGPVARVATILSGQGLNIDIITRLSGRPARIVGADENGHPRRAWCSRQMTGRGGRAWSSRSAASRRTRTRLGPS